MPLREIEDKFTLSELVMTAWRSQEIASQMGKDVDVKTSSSPTTSKNRVHDEIDPETQKRKPGLTHDLIESLPDRFFNEEGDLDLRRVSSEDALKFFQAAGMPIF